VDVPPDRHGRLVHRLPVPSLGHRRRGIYAWKDGRENCDTFTTVFEYGPENDASKGFQVVFSSRQTNAARGNVENYYRPAERSI
jgi:hypothetical protein